MLAGEEAASVGQRMLWLIERSGGRRGQLNYPLLVRLRGELDPALIPPAVQQLVIRHETLRTTLARRQGLLTQLIGEPAPVPVTWVQVAGEEELARRIREESSDPVDPSRSPLRVTVWTLGDRDRVVCLNMHHLATDAWSCRVLAEDLLHLLTTPAPLPRVGWQYRHFVRWQRRETTAGQLARERGYWQDRLDGAQPVALPEPAVPQPTGNRTIQIDLDRGGSDALQALARREQTTLFTVLLALYYTALHQETGQLDLAVAAPFANRTRPEVMRSVGFFANMLILRTRLSPSGDLAGLVRATRTTVNEAIANQGVGYYAVPATNPDAGGWGRLAGVVFQLLPDLPAAPAIAGGLAAEVLPPHIAGRFDVELTAIPHRDGLRALFQYAPDRVDEAVAQRLAANYEAAIVGVAAGVPAR